MPKLDLTLTVAKVPSPGSWCRIPLHLRGKPSPDKDYPIKLDPSFWHNTFFPEDKRVGLAHVRRVTMEREGTVGREGETEISSEVLDSIIFFLQ